VGDVALKNQKCAACICICDVPGLAGEITQVGIYFVVKFRI